MAYPTVLGILMPSMYLNLPAYDLIAIDLFLAHEHIQAQISF